MQQKAISIAITFALAAPVGVQAVEYAVSGQVNRMIRFADNGDGSDVQHVDNDESTTRFRIRGSEDLGGGLKAGVYIETSVASNDSANLALKADDGGDTAFDIRHSALWFAGSWGRATLGHTSEAQDNTSFADLSKTSMVNKWSSAIDHGRAIVFGGTTTTMGGAFSSFDGGRRDVLRYDSPPLGPVTVAASVGNNSTWSVAAFAAGSLGGGEYSAAAGYTDLGGTTGPTGSSDKWSGSLSYLFSQGTSFTFGYGGADGASGASDPDMYYAKLGHQWGSHALSVHYGESSDVSARGEDNTMWGLGWVYALRKDAELYAGYNSYELDRPGAGDVDMLIVGSRVKF